MPTNTRLAYEVVALDLERKEAVAEVATADLAARLWLATWVADRLSDVLRGTPVGADLAKTATVLKSALAAVRLTRQELQEAVRRIEDHLRRVSLMDPGEIAQRGVAATFVWDAPPVDTGPVAVDALLARLRSLRLARNEDALRDLDAGRPFFSRDDNDVLNRAVAASVAAGANVLAIFDTWFGRTGFWRDIGVVRDRRDEVFQQIPDRLAEAFAREAGSPIVRAALEIIVRDAARPWDARLIALEALIRAGAEGVDTLLVEVLGNRRNDPRLRSWAAAGLGRLEVPTDEVIQALAQALGDASDLVRRDAAWALAQLAADETALRTAWESRDPEVRAWAVWGLAKMNVLDATEILRQALRDSAFAVRVRAVLSLSVRPDLEVERAVRDMLGRERDTNVLGAWGLIQEAVGELAPDAPDPGTGTRGAFLIYGQTPVRGPWALIFDLSGSVNPRGAEQRSRVFDPLVSHTETTLAEAHRLPTTVVVANSRLRGGFEILNPTGRLGVRIDPVTRVPVVAEIVRLRRIAAEHLGVGRADLLGPLLAMIGRGGIGTFVVLTDGNPTEGVGVTPAMVTELLRRALGAGGVIRLIIAVPPGDALSRVEGFGDLLIDFVSQHYMGTSGATSAAQSVNVPR